MAKSKRKPVIGISTNILTIGDAPFIDHQRIYINRGYVDSIVQAGGVPLLLPVHAGIDAIDQLLEGVDGILLSGGQDVHPALYSEEPHSLLGSTSTERDVLEMHLFKHTQTTGKPLLGICRGLQFINVALGGTLYQDLSLRPKTSIQHAQTEKWNIASHYAYITPQSKLHAIFQTCELKTNSFHHQAINKLAPGLSIGAISADGVIEGIEGQSESWLIGVQWHPELLVKSYPEAAHLFYRFVQASALFGGLS